MTHAESQELLLDLAYGELSAARAEEVQAHLAGCAECQREKAALDETRRMAAPLREQEEPPAGFDDRILAAARAQAQLEHDGNIGQVIEVSGSVRPMGLEAARIDAHAKHRTAEAPRRPRWAMRVALGGSVAAAAALALVVSTSLQSKREAAERASQVSPDRGFEIRIQPAPVPQAANEAMHDARRDEAATTQAAPAAAPARKDAAPEPAAPRLAKKQAAPEAMAPAGGLAGLGAANGARGSGGDALDTTSANEARGPAKATPPPAARAEAKAEPVAEEALRQETKSVVVEAAKPEPKSVVAEAPKRAAEPPPAAAPAGQERTDAPRPAEAANRVAQAASSARPASQPAAIAAAPKKLEAQGEPAPAELERAAQEARRGGDRASAAGLYRKAARLRQEAGETSAEAAWDLAHAVECLAAIGQFDEARQVRAELSRLYPSEKAAWSAAGRALREVDPPAKAKASEPSVPANH